MKNRFSTLLLCLLSFNCLAQDVKLFKNFGVDNPMSYNFVRTITQDKNGFIWFGSSEGLDRFDGHESISFHHDAALPNSLSSDVISRIIIDSKDRLWVGTFGGGLNLYRENTQDFLRLTSKTEGLEITNDTVNALFEDSQGQIWVGTENGLSIISEKQGKWIITNIYQTLGNQASLTHNTIHSIVEVKSDEIWVGTNGGGISVFDQSGNFIKSIKYGSDVSSTYVNKFINTLFVDTDENVWVGTVDSGLLQYNLSTEKLTHFTFKAGSKTSLTSNAITDIYQDSEQKIWIATDNGLSIYNNITRDFSRYHHSINNPFSLSSDYIIKIFEDINNIMWIGTFSGVNRWDPNMATFRQYSLQTNPEVKNFNITSFTQFDEQHIIFSAYSGAIYQLSLTDNSITPTDYSSFFSEFRVMSLVADGNMLWVGTRSSGLFSVNLVTNKINQYSHDSNNPLSLPANSVTDIIKDRNGQLWVSTFHQGISKMNNDGTFSHFSENKHNPESGPSSNHVIQILEDEEGFIWIATFGSGLNRFDPAEERFIHFSHDETKLDSLSTNSTWVMALDRNKNLWIGTQAAGLNILSYDDRRKGNFSFKHIDTKDGMKSMTVYGITEDVYGDIWLSTTKGISRYSPLKGTFKHFDLTHGLVDLEYTHSAIFSASDNTIFFGSGKGFNSVNPEKVNIKLKAPEVRLTNIIKLNESMPLETSLAKLSHLELNYNDQFISFEYVGLNYANPESTRYKYRLLGFEQEWLDAGKSRRATYTNLPAGKFQLQIIAGNSDDVWSEPGLSLDIVVNPAPWNTWWAYVLYTLAVAIALLFYSRFLNRKLVIEQQQKLYLEQQVYEKTQKFTSKNLELAQANKQLEKAAIVDKTTGVKSRRYLDIYIEQTSQLMNQIHQSLLPVQRELLPRLYILMVRLKSADAISNSQLINLTDLLQYSSNSDDLVIRWSQDTFAVIGYEKGNNANELAARLSGRLKSMADDTVSVNLAYSFFPFSQENPLDLTWDQISVLIEQALTFADEDKQLAWLGLCGPKSNAFDYLQLMQQRSLVNLKEQVVIKSGLA